MLEHRRQQPAKDMPMCLLISPTIKQTKALKSFEMYMAIMAEFEFYPCGIINASVV